MEPLKIILLVIKQAQSATQIQSFAQKIEALCLKENVAHIQNLILTDDDKDQIDKKIDQMTNTNCEVLIILNLSELSNLPSEQFINHKLVITVPSDFEPAGLIHILRAHQKTVERSFGCKKGCL